MTGQVFLDGEDIYTTYKVFITEGGYNGLLTYPPMKQIGHNDWLEEDGIEPDLSTPKLGSREFTISFASHIQPNATDFIDKLSDGAYHTFTFMNLNILGRSYQLRLVSVSNLTLAKNIEVFSLTFADDFPLMNYSYIAPQSNIPKTGYELDGRDLSEYGITITEGTLAEILKTPSVKKNLLQNYNYLNGAIYDGENVIFQTKEVKLNCLMRSSSLIEFWRNYDAFLYDLARPEERMLYVENTDKTYPCYYKSCNVIKFAPVGKIWLQFQLTLLFISFRTGEIDYLLAAEDDNLIITENGMYYIDMKKIWQLKK